MYYNTQVRYRVMEESSTWIEQETIHTIVKGNYVKYYMELENLRMNKTYETDLNGTHRSTFRTRRNASENWSPRLVFFGDLGYTNDQLLEYLPEESEAGAVDAIVFFGDMVYWANGETENSFMRDLSRWSGNGSVRARPECALDYDEYLTRARTSRYPYMFHLVTVTVEIIFPVTIVQIFTCPRANSTIHFGIVSILDLRM